MDTHPQPSQAFISALITEHFVLQSARSTTVSESVGRSGVYLTCVSSALIAFGFFAAAIHHLAPVVATVLPALIILGIFTFVRMVETSVENMVFLRRIEAIRRYYATLDPAAAAFFASTDRNHQHPDRRRHRSPAQHSRRAGARGYRRRHCHGLRGIRPAHALMYRRGQPAIASGPQRELTPDHPPLP